MNNLHVVKQMREIAADALLNTLDKFLKSDQPISEVNFRDAWLNELRKYSDIFPDSWYIPPPHGIAALFASDKNVERVNFKSLRPQGMWPRPDVYLDTTNGLVYLFACPVEKKTGLIGD